MDSNLHQALQEVIQDATSVISVRAQGARQGTSGTFQRVSIPAFSDLGAIVSICLMYIFQKKKKSANIHNFEIYHYYFTWKALTMNLFAIFCTLKVGIYCYYRYNYI